MLRKKDNVDYREFKEHGFKFGTRDRPIYKTTSKTDGDASIYIDLIPCHNNNDEIKIELERRYIPEKIQNKLYDLIQAGLVEKVNK